MLSKLLDNLYAFAMSIPTNLVILLVVCLILIFVVKKPIGFCVRIVLGYLLIGFLLGCFGINMPSFITCWNWIVDKVTALWNYIW